jgi:hypothetical protein
MREAALAVVALLWVGGCADGGVVEIHLSHPADLRPSEQLSELVIRILDADLSRRIVEVQIDGRDVGHGGVADLGALRPGQRYVAHVVANARERCLASGGRVVGRSVPFEHRSGPYRVPVQVGCADEYAAVEPLHFPRLAHALVPLSDGSAYVFGGGRNQLYAAPGVEIPEPFEGLNDTRLVERYQPAERGFSDHAVLDEVRVLPSGTATTDDAMAVVGGQLASIFCDSQVEVVLASGQIARRVSALDERQCGPTVARIGDRIAIVGGALRNDAADPPYQHDAVILDGLANGVIAELDTGRYRYSPVVVPFDDGSGAFVAGGGAVPFAEILWLPPGGEPRFEPVLGGPDPGWTEGQAAFVPCASGGGAVYVVGGSYGGPDPEALDRTWCYRYPGGGVDPEPALIDGGLLPTVGPTGCS